ncbi:NINE protein [Acidicapsa dinghuensis]|uniref:NINE protein n=1 Tax=Acidicapsa dinghuensis TaxID=2218256 RepID=A0ABW1EKF2_9BACT|nr:NINE protein [Acidicapsa dinghuensis]
MGTAPYPNQQVIFQQQYEAVRKDELIAVLLALFLGGFGAHHFYMGRIGLGVLYLVFSWTGIPWIIGWVECFFMPGRVRMYNAVQAAALAAALGITVPGWAGYPGWVAPGFAGAQGYAAAPGYATAPVPGAPMVTPAPGVSGETTLVVCSNCRNTNPLGSRFCSSCGQPLG